MKRYRSTFPLDEEAFLEGDGAFYGVMMRGDVAAVPPGLLTDGTNLRFTNGVAAPRLGVWKPGWLNRVAVSVDDRVRPWGTVYGQGVFKDPNGFQWVLIAADGGVYRCKENNQVFALPLPAGVEVRGTCSFVQCFNKVYLFRGRYLKPLRLSNIDDGFEVMVADWDEAKADYAEEDEVAFGPFQAVDEVWSEGGTAFVQTSVAHGYVTGQDVTVRGAVETAYNGRFPITVIDEVSFRYLLPEPATSPASGTVTVSSNMQYWSANAAPNVPGAGESPESDPTKWTRIYNVIPNADFGLYVNDRLLIPTAYTPGPTAYDTTSTYTKVDFVVATDIADELHFSNTNFFRINQGSNDEIVDLVKFNENTVLVFKSGSWGVLSNVQGTLNGIQFDLRSEEYGLTARGAVVATDTNCYFMAEKRGIVSLRQSDEGKTIGVDLPLSEDVRRLVDRINWNFAGGIRLALWGNRLYAAVPLDEASVWGSEMVDGNYVYPEVNAAAFPMELVVVPGETYAVLIHGAEESWAFGDGPDNPLELGRGDDPEPEVEVATGDRIFIYGSDGETTTASVKRLWRGVNNAILVYDFVNKQWCGRDSGAPILPVDFFKAKCGGVERLFYVGADGWVNLYEQAEGGDMIQSVATDSGTAWVEISTSATTRGYRVGNDGEKKGRRGAVVIETLNPTFSILQRTAGVGTERSLVSGETRSRTRYTKPFTKAAWVATNAGDDHGDANREDYSVVLGDDGMVLGSGVALSLMQEARVGFRVPARSRWTQLVVTNVTGRLVLKGVEWEGTEGRRK